MGLTTINIKVDENDKREFNAICEKLGLSMSEAINIFIKAVIRERGIPFELKLPKPNDFTKKVTCIK